MRRTSTMLTTLAVTGALVLGGCAQEGEEAGELTVTEEQSETTESEEMKRSAPIAEVTLEPRNESGVTGTAKVKRKDGAHELVVKLDGAGTDEAYMAHVHTGTCGNDAGVALALSDFRAEDGNQKSVTVLETAKVDPTGDHFVQVHRLDGTPVACSNIDLEGIGGSTETAEEWDSSLDTAESDAGQKKSGEADY